jgi:hypothetical protein
VNLARVQWFWHRLRAMNAVELCQHLRRFTQQRLDAWRSPDWRTPPLDANPAFPPLPSPNDAPEELRAALRHDAACIMAGRWLAFGHLDLEVDDPPRWHFDYLARCDLSNHAHGWQLNHRRLPGGADIKLVWELSRWTQLTRLAMAAHVLNDPIPAQRCLAWLEDWDRVNPPFRGWNWTSALEAGLRLIQLAWMDALLEKSIAATNAQTTWHSLLQRLLPPHVRFVWRDRSFGSSANNHLLGELAGLIVAVVRWPALVRWTPHLERLHARWEREVLSQFAEDGGNREQALHYQLFSWELCWQTRLALRAANRSIATEVEQRLADAAHFFTQVHAGDEPWDYGDSDSAHVTPFFARESTAIQEWAGWLAGSSGTTAIGFWLGTSPASGSTPRQPAGGDNASWLTKDWQAFPHSGLALHVKVPWRLRWDLTPLGYLKPAAHGHLDALHLSIWYREIAIVIDPGTGVYYVDPELRAWLASRAAHNAPCPVGPEHPRRLGPFLWSAHHPTPTWQVETIETDEPVLSAQLRLPSGVLRRSMQRVREPDGWRIVDSFDPAPNHDASFSVHWQFAPGTECRRLDERRFQLRRRGACLELVVSDDWANIELVDAKPSVADAGPGRLAGTVSPAFRQIGWAPFLRLQAVPGDKPCVFSTSFLACADK